MPIFCAAVRNSSDRTLNRYVNAHKTRKECVLVPACLSRFWHEKIYKTEKAMFLFRFPQQNRLHPLFQQTFFSAYPYSNFPRSLFKAFFSILLTYSPVKLGLKNLQLFIKTSFPSKAKPYFRMRSPEIPRFSKSA